MTIAVGDILRLTAFQSLFNQQVLNVFFYEVEALPPSGDSLLDFADSWAQEYAAKIYPYLVSDLTLDRVLVDNLTQPLFFEDRSVAYAGASSGDALPSFNAIGVKQLRSTKVTRNGSKRLAGVPEATVTDGVWTQPQSIIDIVEDFLGGTVSIPSIADGTDDYIVWNAIVGRTLVGTTYELDLSRVNRVESAKVNTQITSQVSRKVRQT